MTVALPTVASTVEDPPAACRNWRTGLGVTRRCVVRGAVPSSSSHVRLVAVAVVCIAVLSCVVAVAAAAAAVGAAAAAAAAVADCTAILLRKRLEDTSDVLDDDVPDLRANSS